MQRELYCRISPNLWESDGDVKSYHGKWSDGEDDMKSPISYAPIAVKMINVFMMLY